MNYWITPDGNYYVGDYVAEGSIEVTVRPSEYHEWIDGEWVFDVMRNKIDRINLLLSAYEMDRDKLSKAWLAAAIADGIGEADRQAALKQQMDDLATQLDTDILTIFMEE